MRTPVLTASLHPGIASPQHSQKSQTPGHLGLEVSLEVLSFQLPVVQMGKLRLGEASLSEGHTADKWQTQPESQILRRSRLSSLLFSLEGGRSGCPGSLHSIRVGTVSLISPLSEL